MGELSDRFAELMARMAKSDAELFRTIGQQNNSIRQLVDEFSPTGEGNGASNHQDALSSAALLPLDQCDQKALKIRFGKVAEAQAWVESQIGKAPKKPTWFMIEQACRISAWPETGSKTLSATKGITAEALDNRLTLLEKAITHRFDRLEQLILLITEQYPSALVDRAHYAKVNRDAKDTANPKRPMNRDD
jgi:hypothetical protein